VHVREADQKSADDSVEPGETSASEPIAALAVSNLLDQVGDLILELGLDGRLLFVSASAERLLGRAPKGLTGLSLMELVVPEDRGTTLAAFQKVVETGAEPMLSLRIPRSDGLLLELETVIRSFRDPLSAVRRVVAVGRDVTQRAATGAVERERGGLYRSIVEAGPHLAAIISSSGEILLSNRPFQRTFGRASRVEELVSRMAPDERLSMSGAWPAALRNEASGNREFELVDDDGRRRWLAATWEAIHDESGDRRLALLFHDITQMREIETALHRIADEGEGPESIRITVESLASALCLDRLFVAVRPDDSSDRLSLVAEFGRDERSASDPVDVDGLPEQAVMRGEPCIHPTGLQQILPSTRERLGVAYDSFAGLPIRLADGRVIGLVAGYGLGPIGDTGRVRTTLSVLAAKMASRLDHDRSDAAVQQERDALAQALQESEARLSQAQKMEAVGRLAGGVAHDFNNLLTAIVGYGDLALDGLDEDDPARGDIEEVLRAAERAGGLTRQLLAFSRRQVARPEPIDLNAIVADTDRMLRRLIGENIEIVTMLDGELALTVADPGQIEQVIVNLAVNARDAMPRGGRLEIETRNLELEEAREVDSGVLAPGAWVVLSISDRGIGMDEQTRARIFEPFFTTKQLGHGTGLGLAMVSGIIDRCGGRIGLSSAPGEGTTFSVYLPTSAGTTAEKDPDAVDRRLAGHEAILLVEDSEPLRRLVTRTLERHGYQVLATASATGALRLCSRHPDPIDLLLTDVVLPRNSGPELAARARELQPGLRVLYMSGFSDDTLLHHGLSPDEAELIEKPFAPTALLSRIRSLLEPSESEPKSDSSEISHSLS